MARFSSRLRASSGSCGPGCWPERDSTGREYCYCGDTGATMQGVLGTGLLGLLSVVVVAGIGGAFAGRAIKRRRLW